MIFQSRKGYELYKQMKRRYNKKGLTERFVTFEIYRYSLQNWR